MEYFHIEFVLVWFSYMNLWRYHSRCHGRVTRHSLFENVLEDSFRVETALSTRFIYPGELGTIASRWSNRVVAILGKLGPNRSSFCRSCEQNGKRNSDCYLQSASILCHQLFNYLFSGYRSSLLCLVWLSRYFWLFLVGERTKTTPHFLQGQKMSKTHFTQGDSVQDG